MKLVMFPLMVLGLKRLVRSATKSQLQAHDVHTYTPTSHTHFSLYHSHKHVHICRLWLLLGGGDHWQHT